VEDGIGEDVLEPVISEIDFVVADQRILLQAVMRGLTSIVNKSAQSELRRFNAAAHGRTALQHDDAKSRLRQIRSSDQTVVSRSGHDDIEAI